MSRSADDDGPADRLRAAVGALRQWQRGDERAPHKPLLVLHALGRVARGEPRLIAFADVEAELADLLETFGRPRSRQQPRYPFWRLRTDGMWEIEGAETLSVDAGGDPPVGELRRRRGGFPCPQWQRLRDDPALVAELARMLLEAHFPPSYHEDLLTRVGLTGAVVTSRVQRDPTFRVTVLRAYEYRCAVCGWDGVLDTTPVALEAAHVRWHAAGGPETPDNGLALCALHHQALDRGAIGIDAAHQIMVAQAFHGSRAAQRWVTLFAGLPLSPPQADMAVLDETHRAWHEREVFRGPPRADRPARAAEPPADYEP